MPYKYIESIRDTGDKSYTASEENYNYASTPSMLIGKQQGLSLALREGEPYAIPCTLTPSLNSTYAIRIVFASYPDNTMFSVFVRN